jgi:8-oxo-dGTP pyrophosphatase MutT (NUDIX family)
VADEPPAIKHGTSSVFVFGCTGRQWRLGLIRHPRLRRMMIPGGHIEQAESPAEAAVREVAEEAALNICLLAPPAAPLPAGYRPPRVAPPWWIAEYRVPPDSHRPAPHVHVDHLYLALAGRGERPGQPAHPFGWYRAADLARLPMFDDARLLALALLSALDAAAPPARPHSPAGLAAALAATLRTGA